MNIGVHIPLLINVFKSFGQIPGEGYNNSILNFLRNHRSVSIVTVPVYVPSEWRFTNLSNTCYYLTCYIILYWPFSISCSLGPKHGLDLWGLWRLNTGYCAGRLCPWIRLQKRSFSESLSWPHGTFFHPWGTLLSKTQKDLKLFKGVKDEERKKIY